MCIWFLLGFFLKRRSLKRKFIWLGIGYLLFFSNRFIANEALLFWEIPPTPFEDITTDYQAGIVLGGITNSEILPRDRVYFLKGADRVTHAMQLYKLGKIKKILVTGGSSNLINTEHKEADNLYDFLILAGVSASDILVDRDARNTYENAVYATQLLNSEFPDSKHLVITSAFHMRRALNCFELMDIEVDGFSADFYSHTRSFTPDQLFVPDPSAFYHWHLIVHEILGILSYKVAGYL